MPDCEITFSRPKKVSNAQHGNDRGCKHAPTKHLVGSKILFWGCLIAFIASPLRDTTDSFLTLHTAVSLARGLWGDIAPIAPNVVLHPTVVSLADGRILSNYPIGPAFLLTPIAWIADRLFPESVEWFLRNNSYYTHKVFASTIGALTIVIFYKAMLRRFDHSTAITLALILAFATSIWSTTTRGLWTHGPLVMWVCVAFYFTPGPHSTKAAALAGAASAAAFAMRPTGVIAILAIGNVFAWRGPRALGWYALGCGIGLSLWAALQIATYGQLIPAYYNPKIMLSVSAALTEAMVGNLASPSRGLFVFSLCCCSQCSEFSGRFTRAPIDRWESQLCSRWWLNGSLSRSIRVGRAATHLGHA